MRIPVRLWHWGFVAGLLWPGTDRGTIGSEQGGHPAGARSQQPSLTEQVSGVGVTLQAVSPVSDSVAWVSGHGGAVLRTLDGGSTWERLAAPGLDSLQFRDVYATSRDRAYLLSAGPGERSRIYRTSDGGSSWQLQFFNREASAFYDCFDFWDERHGLAVSDAVSGRLVILETVDAGASWRPIPPEGIPEAAPVEGAFAASGTCLVVLRPVYAWIGTGAGGEAKVYRSQDGGRTWRVASLPFGPGSPASGVLSLAFRDSVHGVALGGDLNAPGAVQVNVARTEDGGASWTLGGRLPFPGAIFGSAYAKGREGMVLVAVGPGGAAYSGDDGRTWSLLSPRAYWAVGFGAGGVGWMVGPEGRITKVRF